MEKYAIIGHPVGHSLSPAMHNAAFAEIGLDADYRAFDVEPGKLESFMEGLAKELNGFNVTVPYKSAVADYLDQLDVGAATAGSVNTVKRMDDGSSQGYSTDGYGLEKALEESFGVKVAGKNFLVLGAGGAARAACFHLLASSAASVSIANRTFNKAEALADELKRQFPIASVEAAPASNSEKLANLVERADVLVQSTSLGLRPDDPSPFPKELLRADMPVFDMIYKRTRLIEDAGKAGALAANGIEMLVHQGAKSFEIWTGKNAPVATMRRVVENALAKMK